jgi:cephalosporin hydroxylase
MEPSVALDKRIALEYARFLLDSDVPDSPEARRKFCDQQKLHPKLLYFNPHIRSLARLFSDGASFERLQEMTLRDWMLYHHHYVHQAYRYGDPEMQQKWLGRDILKSPMDCWIYQEIIARVRPDVLIELGVMFGGASLFYASIMELIGHGSVLGIDISLAKVESVDNPRITYIEGSSTAPETLARVHEICAGKKVMVIADSDHEKNHVLGELRAYEKLVPVGSYLIAEDSLNDVMQWHPVPNEGPKAAAHQFLQENDSFVVDIRYAEKYILTLSPYGFLLRVK